MGRLSLVIEIEVSSAKRTVEFGGRIEGRSLINAGICIMQYKSLNHEKCEQYVL